MLIKNTEILQIFNTFKYYRLCHNVFQEKLGEFNNAVKFKHNEEIQKTIKVAIIGTPNAGKSSFINTIVGHQVCAASKKVHTTRGSSRAFTVENNTQIIFVDTPGLVSSKEIKRHNLEKSFLRDTPSSVKQADIIGVIHDAQNSWTRDQLDKKILGLLQKYINIPSFLILNKIDLLKSKRKLLDVTYSLTGNCLNGQKSNAKHPKEIWTNFNRIFMISSLTGDGIEQIKEYLAEVARPSPWLYSSTEYTDQKPETIIVHTVKATLLDFLPQEIPYQLKTELEFYEKHENNSITAVVLVTCPTARIEKLINGVGEGRLKQMTAVAERILWRALDCQVTLKIVTLFK